MIQQTLKVDYNTLVNVISTITKGDFVYVDYSKIVSMNKGGRQNLNVYYNRVIKNVKGRVRPLGDYEKRVTNNRLKEGNENEFEVGVNKVGVHISPCVTFNEKLGKHYFIHEYFNEIPVKVEYSCDNNPIEKHLFQEYMIQRTTPKNQEVDRVVNVCQLFIGNINEITINKTKYILEK